MRDERQSLVNESIGIFIILPFSKVNDFSPDKMCYLLVLRRKVVDFLKGVVVKYVGFFLVYFSYVCRGSLFKIGLFDYSTNNTFTLPTFNMGDIKS